MPLSQLSLRQRVDPGHPAKFVLGEDDGRIDGAHDAAFSYALAAASVRKPLTTRT